MKFLNSGNIQRLRLDQIVITQRLRKVGEAAVETLIEMAEDTGITTPIHVRKVKDHYELIDGAHRVEASRRMGLEDIAALVVECRQDEARAMEASNNLGAARMTPLQVAVFAASWKRDYYAMHPERMPGVFKGNQYTGKVVEERSSLTTSVAEAFGVTERHARNILAVGEALSEGEVRALEAAPQRLFMADLQALAKIKDPGERFGVVETLARGQANSVRAARARLAGDAPEASEKDKVEAALAALQAAWHRAPMAAKRRFVEDSHAELYPLFMGAGDEEAVEE